MANVFSLSEVSQLKPMHCNICGGIVISAKLLSFSQYDSAYLSIKKNPTTNNTFS